ncbi:hypothetical protein C0995_000541 [Termitomyces sp. Mi166|nr:hypothetical protein C0995_000541 [Termitomyces sp. Mi166\
MARRPAVFLQSQSPVPHPHPHPQPCHSQPCHPHPHPQPVKEEPDDPGCFIMELSAPSALAPPTEVPLRATQASSDMRRMMTVFRLNPFAIHNAVGTVPVPLESARALDTEPITFEFQLDIEPGILDPDSAPLTNLRPFSPDFDLHQKVPADPWPAFSSPTPPPLHAQSWDLSYPDAQDDFSYSRLHNSVSQKAPTLAGDSAYTNSSSYNHRITPQPEAVHWAHQSSLPDVGYHTCSPAASRSTTIPYTDRSNPP